MKTIEEDFEKKGKVVEMGNPLFLMNVNERSISTSSHYDDYSKTLSPGIFDFNLGKYIFILHLNQTYFTLHHQYPE